jgi:hypothetical protein
VGFDQSENLEILVKENKHQTDRRQAEFDQQQKGPLVVHESRHEHIQLRAALLKDLEG